MWKWKSKIYRPYWTTRQLHCKLWMAVQPQNIARQSRLGSWMIVHRSSSAQTLGVPFILDLKLMAVCGFNQSRLQGLELGWSFTIHLLLKLMTTPSDNLLMYTRLQLFLFALSETKRRWHHYHITTTCSQRKRFRNLGEKQSVAALPLPPLKRRHCCLGKAVDLHLVFPLFQKSALGHSSTRVSDVLWTCGGWLIWLN